MDYVVVKKTNLEEFVKEVNELINKGYKLNGSLKAFEGEINSRHNSRDYREFSIYYVQSLIMEY